ncbi:MAG: MerR family transcriptional regulator [Candidatus Omnitrophota bacterium]|nr:MAG: MerR family transcriptional regulator [Candidatus Omnitrophota bacterium]
MSNKKEVKINGKKFCKVSELCQILGIFKNTLYNWEKKRKIPKAKRDPMSGWRLYSQEDVARIRKISGR